MKKSIYILTLLSALILGACNDFLDEMPDNRAELNSADKIKKLLVSAYPTSSYLLVSEFSSDNIDDYGETNPNTSRFWEDLAYWKDVKDRDNDDARNVWSSYYKAIASANQALSAIEQLGNPENLQAAKGEALITRAYAHFILVNIFSRNYNAQTSATDLGVPYMEAAEITLNPKYERGNVAKVYEKIQADIEAGLPLINDEIYQVPKYHFNQTAANAFAARFYLFYEKWDKAVEYASKVLGTNPQQRLRNWAALGNLPRTPETVVNSFVQDSHDSNLLIQAHTSSVGVIFGAYFAASRFAHGRELRFAETVDAPQIWSSASSEYFFRPFVYTGTNIDKTLMYKIPYMFQITDPVAQTGFRKTVSVLFSTDEVLLVRAEAYAMLKQYEKAAADINVWTNNFVRTPKSYTAEDINTFYEKIPYYEKNKRSFKKRLNPGFQIEAGMQENMLHCVLQCRRILTLHEGYRWFDIKRYGIEIDRYISKNNKWEIADSLPKDDKRRAIQLPQDVIDAGLTANPR